MIACVIFGELRFIENTNNIIKNSFPSTSIDLYFDVLRRSRKSANDMAKHTFTSTEQLINKYFSSYTKQIFLDDNGEYDYIINNMYNSYNMKIHGTPCGFYSTYRMERAINRIFNSGNFDKYKYIICMRTDTVITSRINLANIEPNIWYGCPNIYIYGNKTAMYDLFHDMHQTFKYMRDNKLNVTPEMSGEEIINLVADYKSIKRVDSPQILFYGVLNPGQLINNETAEHIRFTFFKDYIANSKLSCNTTYDVGIILTKNWVAQLSIRSGYYDFYGDVDNKYNLNQDINILHIFGTTNNHYDKITSTNSIYNIIVLIESDDNIKFMEDKQNTQKMEFVTISKNNNGNLDDYIYESRYIIDSHIPLLIVNYIGIEPQNIEKIYNILQTNPIEFSNTQHISNITFYGKGSEYIKHYKDKYYKTA